MKILISVSVITILIGLFAFIQQNKNDALVSGQRSKVFSETAPAIVIKGEISQAILKTANGCGIGNFLIPAIGDPSLGIPPILYSLSPGEATGLNALDTIPGTEIKGLAFQRNS